MQKCYVRGRGTKGKSRTVMSRQMPSSFEAFETAASLPSFSDHARPCQEMQSRVISDEVEKISPLRILANGMVVSKTRTTAMDWFFFSAAAASGRERCYRGSVSDGPRLRQRARGLPRIKRTQGGCADCSAWFSRGKRARALAPRQLHCCTTLEMHRGARYRARRKRKK